MERHTIGRDDLPDLVFDGDCLGTASSKGKSRDGVRWTEISLYKTRGGKYVCAEVGVSQVEGERTRRRALVVGLESDVLEFFGHGWLSKELYARAGIEAREVIE